MEWLGGKVGKWMEEGSKRVEKVGKRYGILGFEKGSQGEQESEINQESALGVVQEIQERGTAQSGVAEKVASAIAAYVAVKASGLEPGSSVEEQDFC